MDECQEVTLEGMQSFVLGNDLEKCKLTISNMSKSNIKMLVNTAFGSEDENIIDITVCPSICFHIWELLLPYATEETLYRRNKQNNYFKNILMKKLNHQTYYIHDVLKQQLQKVEYWFEMTKNLISKDVRTFRVHFLCELCKLKASNESSFASKMDIESFGQKLLNMYHINLNETHRYPLHQAIKDKNYFFLCLFLSKGADPNRLGEYGTAPLHLSQLLLRMPHRLEVLDLFIEHGASLCLNFNQNGFTTLDTVLLCANPDELDCLLSKHPDILNISNLSMPFPFIHGLIVFAVSENMLLRKITHKSIQQDIIAKISVLCNHGVDLNLPDLHGRNILHYACWFRFTDVADFLLTKKIDPFSVDIFGRGCFYYAISWISQDYQEIFKSEELSTIKYLEERVGAQCFNMTDKHGRTVEDLCTFENNKMAMKFFFEKRSQILLSSNNPVLKPYNEMEQSIDYIQGTEFVKFLLNDSNIGPLKANTLALSIIKRMEEFVRRLADHVGRYDDMFQCTIQLAGSVGEGTKINPPDEFDFQFKLSVLSQHICVNSLTIDNDVKLNAKVGHGDLFCCGINETNQELNKFIYETFNSVIYKTLQNKSFWQDLPFYWSSHRREGIAVASSVVPLRLKLVGAEYADLDISVDLVPVIVIETLPSEMTNLIPEEIINFVNDMNLKWSIVCRKTDARLSFLHVERWILKRLTSEIRDAYILTKCIRRYIEEYGDYDTDEVTSYMLKNALFYELDPNLTYSLLQNSLMLHHNIYPEQKFVLFMIRKTYTKVLENGELYTQIWALKIFDRLENWLRNDKCRVYCRPDVRFPNFWFLDLNILQKCKELLTNK